MQIWQTVDGRMAPLPGGSWGVVDLTLSRETPESCIDVECLCSSKEEAEGYVRANVGRAGLHVAILSPWAVRQYEAGLRPTLGSVEVFDRSVALHRAT